jgi:hypothetical protein
MSIITPSIAAFIGSRFKSFGKRQVGPDLVAEIPPEMRTQLRREGVRLAIALPFLSLGFLTAISIVWNLIDFDPALLETKRLAVFFLIQVGVSVVLYRMIIRNGIAREVRFRELHGKWRWER